MIGHSEDGFTLPELLVFMVLSAIVGTIVASAVRIGFTSQRQVQDRNGALAAARTALERIDRDIRGTDPNVRHATDTEIELEDQTLNETRYVTYAVQTVSTTDADLVLNETDVTNGVTTVLPQQTVLTDLVNTGADPVFRFSSLPSPYVAPSGTNPDDCAKASSSPTQYEPECIGFVTVNIQVQPPSIQAPIVVSDHGTEVINAGLNQS